MNFFKLLEEVADAQTGEVLFPDALSIFESPGAEYTKKGTRFVKAKFKDWEPRPLDPAHHAAMATKDNKI